MLTLLQTQAKDRLDAQEFFSNSLAETPRPISVLVETQKDIQSELDRRLARFGLAVILLTPQLSTRLRAPGVYPAWDRVELSASVIENVTINRTSGLGQPASLVAEAAAYFLHGWAPAVTGNKLMCEGIFLGEDPTLFTYTVRLFTGGITAEAPERI